jgi:hypothetical protein
MTKIIHPSVRFAATPAQLFERYIDSAKHTVARGGKARLSQKVGGAFTAWNKMPSGRNLLIIPNRMVVQSRRSVNFKAGDPDSILVLEFHKAPAARS